VDAAPATLEEENTLLRRQLAERDAELDVARAQIEALTFHLAVLRRRQFGRSSEKLDVEVEQLELRLEDLEESQAEQSARVVQQDAPLRQPRKPAQRKPLPPHLSRETVVHERNPTMLNRM
jgi:chromosome segregation ATPase